MRVLHILSYGPFLDSRSADHDAAVSISSNPAFADDIYDEQFPRHAH